MIKVGQKIKESRLQKGLTLEDVSKSTKIKSHFLMAIENGEYNKLPSSSYAQGFVRNYVSFLGMPEKETLALFRREFDEENIFKVLPAGMAASGSFPRSKIKASQTFVTIFLVFFILLAFIIFQYKDAFINPVVTIYDPAENAKVASSVLISGKTDPDAEVFIEGLQVFTDSSGNFKKTVSLFPGKGEITIKVINRFKRVTEIKRHVEVKILP